MAGNHSKAVVDTHINESTPIAVVVSQGIGDANKADFNINGTFFFFTNLPIELQNKIIGYAVTATDQEIVFPCLTNAEYTPNVTSGLLLVNHRIYHEAHYQLRKQNTFIFGNFGSDLKTIASSIGPFKCRSGACGHEPLRSSLAKVKFNLGDEDLPDHGDDKAYAFGCALRHLRSEITTSSLHIQLGYHTFSTSAKLSSFASALKKIKVEDNVTIIGDERYLEMDFGDIPSSLGMNVMPVYSRFEPYDQNIPYSPGRFHHRYKLGKPESKDTGRQHECLIST